MQFVEILRDNTVRSAGSAPYLDYRPTTEDELAILASELDHPWLMDDLENKALTHAVEHIVPTHLKEVRGPREELIEKSLAAVQTRLKREIAYWDHRAEELKIREQAGRAPKINSIMARQRADDLEGRLTKRLKLLEQQRQISPSPPVAFGGALIIPQGLLAQYLGQASESEGIDQKERQRIDRLAVEAVVTAERALGREPTVMPHNNEGYDIEVRDSEPSGRLRFIEVKGKAVGKPTLTISASQIRCCCNMRDQWTLAIVLVDGDNTIGPKYLKGPFDQAPAFAEVGRNFDVNSLLADAKDPA
jgi:Protein NO VEIN, C-terminal